MATSSILGGTAAPVHPKGTGTDALGPSDSSDSGSDVQGERVMSTGPDDPDNLGAVPADTGSDTDRFGTGERASATPGTRDRADGDILPDRVADDIDADLAVSDADLAGDIDGDLDGDIDAGIDVDQLASGDDPSAGPDAEHAGEVDDDGEDPSAS